MDTNNFPEIQSTVSTILSPVERVKAANPTLAGSIAETVADAQADHFSDDDSQLLKYHGVYQSDDRDVRKTGKKFITRVGVRLPGGVLTPEQYLELDRVATEYGNGTLRITSRQTIQFHRVPKANLTSAIQGINARLLTTLATEGDVVRNVIASPSPAAGALGDQIRTEARKLSEAFSPRTPAYREIWIDGKQTEQEDAAAKDFVDPLYGKAYLPRKFKIAFAIPPVNDVDVFTNDVGLIAIVENGALTGFNLAVGGGMGRSHGNAQTFPRVAEVIGFLKPDQVETAVRAVVTIHRDFGDRSNRKHARLKYVLADRGVDWFRAELERRAGFALASARHYAFTSQTDAFGWHQQPDGNWFLGLSIECGRIQDSEARQTKSALREVVERFQPEVRLTPADNLFLANVQPGQRAAITELLASHGVRVQEQGSAIRLASVACVALPTCGLAMAESERVLPGLITQIESAMDEVGLSGQEIVLRMTGCPNGCVRPYMAEIGLVGKAPAKYQIWLGGSEGGTRLNRLWKDGVKAEDLVGELRPLFIRYAQERLSGERFGDWAARILWS